jgi:hypothetical protein
MAYLRSASRLFAGTFMMLAAGAASAQSVQGVDVQKALANPEVQAAISACSGDRSKLCASIVPGGGRIIKCLASQADKVSPPCKSAIYAAQDSLAKAGIVIAAPAK